MNTIFDFQFTRDLITEMADLEKAFKYSLQPWWDSINSYVNDLKNDLTWTILPLAVMSIYKYVGHNRQFCITMSNIFRYCYLAHRIHALVKDDEEGQQHDRQLQFNILIGDYISGYILKALVDIQADSQVNNFAVMIAEVNEGMVIGQKLNGNCTEVIQKTRVPFYATAFLTAAQLAGYDAQTSSLYQKMGFHLGMSLELGQVGLIKAAVDHFRQCQAMFMQINQRNYRPNSNLEKALNDLDSYFCHQGAYMAI